MSEPMTSPEIEDVLSSIRRLVSDDQRQAQALKAAAKTDAEVKAEEEEVALASGTDGFPADKLILTPALRVVSSGPAVEAETIAEPVSDTAPDAAYAAGEEIGATAASAQPPKSVEPPDYIKRAVAMAAARGQGAEEAPAAEEAPRTEAEGQAFLSAAARFAAVDDEYDDEGSDEPPLGIIAASPLVDEGEILWAASGEPVEEAISEEPQAGPLDPNPRHGHWTAQDVPGVDWAEDELWSDAETDPLPFISHPRKAEAPAAPQAHAWEDAGEDDLLEEAEDGTASRPAFATGQGAFAESGFEELADSVTDSVNETISERVMEAGVHAAHAFQRRSSDFHRADQTRSDLSAALDEQRLRDIMREIIRDELAGTLGEKITRNVRKLVRSEINRALTSREL